MSLRSQRSSIIIRVHLMFDNDVWVWWVIQKSSDECQHVQCLMSISSKPNIRDFAQKLVQWWYYLCRFEFSFLSHRLTSIAAATVQRLTINKFGLNCYECITENSMDWILHSMVFLWLQLIVLFKVYLYYKSNS